MKKLLAVMSLVLVAAVFVPVMAQANSMTYMAYDATGYGFGRIVDGRSTSANTGEFGTVIRDENGQALNGGEWFTALCVEPGTPISQGDTLSQSVRPEDFNNGAGLQAAWLLDAYHTEDASNVEIAGLQLALWEVVKDSIHSLVTGNFQVTSGNGTAIDYANNYLAGLDAGFGSADVNRLNQEYTVFVGAGKQDLIVKTGAVPEPTTMLMFAIGLLGLVKINRFRSKK